MKELLILLLYVFKEKVTIAVVCCFEVSVVSFYKARCRLNYRKV